MGADRRNARFSARDFGLTCGSLKLWNFSLLNSLETERKLDCGGTVRHAFDLPMGVALFLLVSLLAAAVGLASLTGTRLDMARVLFFVFMAFALVLVALGLNDPRSVRGR